MKLENNIENRKIIWVGIRESEVKYAKPFIFKSINIYGNNNDSLTNKLNMKINHNIDKNNTIIGDFYSDKMNENIEKNPDVLFMYYNQLYSYKGLKQHNALKYVVCFNNQKLIKFTNNKFKVKKYLKRYIPILDYKIMLGENINFDNLKNKYGDYKFVIQSASGSGGFGTTVLSKNNKDDIKLSKYKKYMVTKYCKNNIPANIHILISDENIILLPPSIQIIELLNNNLLYKGSDFISYRKVVDKKIDKKLKEYSNVISKILQKKGYRGVLGIDYIIYNDEVYFMEINPRFQNSSTILNKSLQENGLPSLQELVYNCFNKKNFSIPKFDVEYSSYINEYNSQNNKINIKPIEILDESKINIEYEKYSYMNTFVYNKPIWKILNDVK